MNNLIKITFAGLLIICPLHIVASDISDDERRLEVLYFCSYFYTSDSKNNYRVYKTDKDSLALAKKRYIEYLMKTYPKDDANKMIAWAFSGTVNYSPERVSDNLEQVVKDCRTIYKSVLQDY